MPILPSKYTSFAKYLLYSVYIVRNGMRLMRRSFVKSLQINSLEAFQSISFAVNFAYIIDIPAALIRCEIGEFDNGTQNGNFKRMFITHRIHWPTALRMKHSNSRKSFVVNHATNLLFFALTTFTIQTALCPPFVFCARARYARAQCTHTKRTNTNTCMQIELEMLPVSRLRFVRCK